MRIKTNVSKGVAALGLLALPVVSLFGSSLPASAKDIEVANTNALKEALKTVKSGDVLNLSTKISTDWAGSDGFVIKLPEGVTLNGNGVTLYSPIDVTGDNVTVKNVVLVGSGADDAKNHVSGVHIDKGVSGVTVQDSTISKYFRGVSTDDKSDSSDITVKGNTFNGNSDNDVTIWASKGDKYTVSGNKGTNVLQVRGSDASNKLTGVKIENNTVTVTKNTTAIMSVYTKGTSILGNVIDGTNATGALVSLSGADDLQFNGNKLTGGAYGVSATLTYFGKYTTTNKAVTDYAPVKNISFADNTVKGSTKAGVRLNVFDGATFATGNSGNVIESKGNAIQIASQSFKADNTNKGSLVIEKGNNLTGAKAIAADADAKFDKATSKLVVNKGAILNGKTGSEADLADQIDIPAAAGLSVEYTTTPSDNTTDKEVTKPNENKKTEATAPNTGAQNVINVVLGASALAAIAAAGAFVSGKFAKNNR